MYKISALAPREAKLRPFKEGNPKPIFIIFECSYSNDHISGLEWTLSKILKPKINSLTCSIHWSGTQVNSKSGSQAMTIKSWYWLHIWVNFLRTISLAWNGLFQKFQSLKLLVFFLYPSRNRDQTWVDKCQYDSFFKFQKYSLVHCGTGMIFEGGFFS